MAFDDQSHAARPHRAQQFLERRGRVGRLLDRLADDAEVDAPGLRSGGAIDAETLMISRYNAVLAAVPTLAGSLEPLLQQHREHLARLRARLIEPNTASGPERPSAVAASPAGVPGTPAAARAYLRHAEQAAARTLLGKLTAAPPSLAQLLASIAASEATHALVLGPGRAA